jgi:hypothetical protein
VTRKKSKRVLFDFFSEIFQRNQKHTKAFAVFFSQMLVMHFMSTANCPEIPVVAVAENFESLVNEYIVHHKIAKSVNGDSDAYVKLDVATGKDTEEHQQHAWDRKNQEEGIIFFKESCVPLMVIAVQDPKQSVHHILVCKPGHEFHTEKGDQDCRSVD